MHTVLHKQSHKTTIGKLTLGCRNLNLEDLKELEIRYSKGNWHGRVWITLKLLLTGKGFLTLKKLGQLLHGKVENQNILSQFPNLKKILKIDELALTKISETKTQEDVESEYKIPLIKELDFYLQHKIDDNKESEQTAAFNTSKSETSIEKKQTIPEPTVEKIEVVAQKILPPADEKNNNHSSPPKPKTPLVADLIRNHYSEDLQSPNEAWKQLWVKTLEKVKILFPVDTAIIYENNVNGEKENITAHKIGEGVSSKKFIAASAPLEKNLHLFWPVVFDQCDLIIDLTQPEEKITKYTPSFKIEQNFKYGDIHITLLGRQELFGKNILFDYELKNSTGTTKHIQRFNYTQWPDKTAISVHELATLVDLFEKEFKNKKTLIHCRGGVGRTGTLITAYILKEKIKSGEMTLDNFKVKIPEIIVALRQQRRFDFINDESQFILLHDYAQYLLTQRN